MNHVWKLFLNKILKLKLALRKLHTILLTFIDSSFKELKAFKTFALSILRSYDYIIFKLIFQIETNLSIDGFFVHHDTDSRRIDLKKKPRNYSWING